MYRRSVQGPVTGQRVVRFLTCSIVFPRAIAFCAKEAEQALSQLPNSGAVAAAAARLASELAGEPSVSGNETDSSALLTRIQAELAALHDTLTTDYFTLRESVPPRVSQSQSQKA